MDALNWFSNFGCERLRITECRSVSVREVLRHLEISDAEYLRSLQEEISRLPLQGDERIKPGPGGGYLALEFEGEGWTETIEFHAGRIKTPATSFYSDPEPPDQWLWEEMQCLLETPRLGRAVAKIRNHAHPFPAFTVAYLGAEDRTPEHTTATLWVEAFEIVASKDSAGQVVEVRYGQLPPRPQPFQVAGESYVLDIQTDGDGHRLAPWRFVVRH